MIAAVVPAKNEEGRISKVLINLIKIGVDKIITVINGSTDNTLYEVQKLSTSFAGKIKIIHFKEALGYDVPKAVGAYTAYKDGAECVIFVDGDMEGKMDRQLKNLIKSIEKEKADLSLTRFYPDYLKENRLSLELYYYKRLFNETLNLYHKVYTAIPSHGPHAVSGKFLQSVDFCYFAIPPLESVFAVKEGLKVAAPSIMRVEEPGSKLRGFSHAKKMADTIIGDIIQALNLYKGLLPSRIINNREFIGYHGERRFDILKSFIS
ncbi:glycosyltransferase [Thermovenabulum sp.]|uniref:glycosyltransferase n=1 Tax=Thermovenabulum sp. TaxID=3100335 RepID=UPI003C7BC3A0